MNPGKYSLRPLAWQIEGAPPDEPSLILYPVSNGKFEVRVGSNSNYGPNLTRNLITKVFFVGCGYPQKDPEPRDSAQFATIEEALDVVSRYHQARYTKLKEERVLPSSKNYTVKQLIRYHNNVKHVDGFWSRLKLKCSN